MSSDKPIGPALPPMFGNQSDEEESEDDFAGPALPPGYKRGEPSSSSDEGEREVSVKRAKTRHSSSSDSEEKSQKPDDDDGFFGPALPPGFKKQQSSPIRPPVVGPALPPGFRRAACDDSDDDDEDDDEGSPPGPALPPGYRCSSSEGEEEEEEVIGPMPATGPCEDSVVQDFERRAEQMKKKLTGEDDVPEVLTRETWMTELPPELQHIGLGARTFKKKSGPENKDRSIWTDTPADRERKIRERLEGKKKDDAEKESAPKIPPKDLDMADKVSKYNDSKRAESLMTLHSKKMKEKAKEKAEAAPAERRPFDRDEDLQVNRFDEAQKQRLLKKSQELNTRFSHSKDRMFL